MIAGNNEVIDNVAEKTPPKKKRGRPAKAKAGMANILLLVFVVLILGRPLLSMAPRKLHSSRY